MLCTSAASLSDPVSIHRSTPSSVISSDQSASYSSSSFESDTWHSTGMSDYDGLRSLVDNDYNDYFAFSSLSPLTPYPMATIFDLQQQQQQPLRQQLPMDDYIINSTPSSDGDFDYYNFLLVDPLSADDGCNCDKQQRDVYQQEATPYYHPLQQQQQQQQQQQNPHWQQQPLWTPSITDDHATTVPTPPMSTVPSPTTVESPDYYYYPQQYADSHSKSSYDVQRPTSLLAETAAAANEACSIIPKFLDDERVSDGEDSADDDDSCGDVATVLNGVDVSRLPTFVADGIDDDFTYTDQRKQGQAADSSCKNQVGRRNSHVTSPCADRLVGKNTGKTTKRRTRSPKQQQLWQFLLETLANPAYNPGLIEWVDRQRGIFRFVESQKVARLWGQRRKRDNMSYEYFSRAMRHYYARGIMNRVCGRRLVYQFGPNADGWQLT